LPTDGRMHESAKMVRLYRDKTERGVGEITVVTAEPAIFPWQEKLQ